jgi:hypothetical protein
MNINLSGFTTTTEKKKKTEKPIIPCPAEAVTSFVEAKASFESAEGVLKATKGQLLEHASQEFWKLNNQRVSQGQEPASTAEMLGDNVVARITLARIYPVVTDTAPLVSIVGEQVAQKGFRQTFDFKVEGAKIPASHAQTFVDGLRDLVAKCGAGEAVTIKAGIQPTEQFHTERHKLLTPEQNMALQAVCPARLYVA